MMAEDPGVLEDGEDDISALKGRGLSPPPFLTALVTAFGGMSVELTVQANDRVVIPEMITDHNVN